MGQIPVFNLMKKLSPHASVKEVLEEMSGDFELEKRPMFYLKNDGTYQQVRYHSVGVRKDSELDVGGVVGSRYGVIQFQQSVEFLDSLVGSKQAEFYTGKVLDDGSKLILVMRATDTVDLGLDKFQMYFTVSTAHDGTGTMLAICSPIHDASQTVFTPILGSGKSKGVVKVKHTANAQANLATARRVITDMHDYWAEFSDVVKRMAQVQITNTQAQEYFMTLWPGDSTKSQNIRDRLYNLYAMTGSTCKLPSCKGTLFGAFMAVMQNADYYKTTKLKGARASDRTDVDIKIEARLMGAGAKEKMNAYGMAVKLANL